MDLEMARIKATILMHEHGLLAAGWKFDFKKRRLPAQCNPNQKKITLSEQYAQFNEWEPHLKNSVLHEIAHVLAPPIYFRGRWYSHHDGWQSAHIRIGGNGSRCVSNEAIVAERKSRGQKEYIAYCACGKKHVIHRKGKRFNDYICKYCKQRLVFRELATQGV